MYSEALKIGVVVKDTLEQHALARIVEFMGHEVTGVGDSDVVMISGDDDDVRLPPDVPVVSVGETESVARNVVASVHPMRFHNLQTALHEVRTILDDGDLDTPVRRVLARLLGSSGAIRRVRDQLEKVVNRVEPVLLTGEAGTGKEFVARTLHAASDRGNGPFVPLNCGTIQAELLESELFGHERGAFIGALSGKPGRIELASGGTLFLEDVGALDYKLQLKLLRVLQSGRVARMGTEQARVVDARVIVADRGELEARMHSGEFREDLYYHLAVFPIEIPPLRERVEDLSMLVDAIAADIEKEQRLVLTLSVDVLDVIRRYPWPGNLRELRNFLQRMAIQSRNDVITTRDLPARIRELRMPDEAPVAVQEVTLADVPESVRLPVNGLDLKDYLARLERSLIEQALDDADAVVARAADRLHIRRTTLVEKMRKYGITR
ncbi:MAG: sigma-54-dependent Fis family transcriptional regulator [Pseudomonadales bacterium]|nr:sigma-54-dependent Fis family transcriptional regulator [Pseudomonadales bacterium]MCP5184739.1 sigma-54-dependent Fis family transcriptional regulator [Pseudomonadales bacterium]